MDPGNPSEPSGPTGPGPEPDPNQPGWASPAPPPPPAAPDPWTTTPGPPAAAPTGPAPVRKRRMTWLWILIPTLFVLVAATVVTIVFAARLVVGPIAATDDYFEHLEDGEYATAYDSRCDAFKAQMSLDDFVSRERAAGPVRDFDFDDFDTDGDDATVDGTVERGGFRYRVTVHLVSEGDDWKVCRIDARR